MHARTHRELLLVDRPCMVCVNRIKYAFQFLCLNISLKERSDVIQRDEPGTIGVEAIKPAMANAQSML